MMSGTGQTCDFQKAPSRAGISGTLTAYCSWAHPLIPSLQAASFEANINFRIRGYPDWLWKDGTGASAHPIYIG